MCWAIRSWVPQSGSKGSALYSSFDQATLGGESNVARMSDSTMGIFPMDIHLICRY